MRKLQFNENTELGSDAWKKRMTANGLVLQKNKVREVFLVHGTFAGDDAFGLVTFLEPLRRAFPHANTLIEKLKSLSKQSVDKIYQDLGNFTNEYMEVFQTAINHNINCHLFTWSGGNYHLARLKGVVELVQNIADEIKNNNIAKDERILLLGHSHAGQLFALLTLFLEDGDTAKALYKAVDAIPNLSREELIENLLIIDNIDLDFVTFGTPVRYKWGKYNHARLISVINHRSLVQIAGVLETKDGDYIQQWGTAGTDIMPPIIELKLNDQLDRVLDKGRNITGLITRLQRKRRMKAKDSDGNLVGHTVLVDYRDDEPDPRLFPQKSSPLHSVRTQFGHGVYTLKNAMLFNTDLIVQSLYADTY
jgi:hypothetical protein